MTTKIHTLKKESKENWLDKASKVSQDIHDILTSNIEGGKNVVITITNRINDKEIKMIEECYPNQVIYE